MSLHIAYEIWNAISHSVAMNEERKDLADQIVGILIDADYSIEDIRQEFEGERLIQAAIKYHADDADEADYKEDEDDDYGFEDDFDDDEWD